MYVSDCNDIVLIPFTIPHHGLTVYVLPFAHTQWTHYQAVTRAPVKMSARGKLDTASVQRAKDFCEHRLLNDNWRATADDPYGQVEFVAAVASVFGTTDNRTLEASVPPRLSVEQLAFISYRVSTSIQPSFHPSIHQSLNVSLPPSLPP